MGEYGEALKEHMQWVLKPASKQAHRVPLDRSKRSVKENSKVSNKGVDGKTADLLGYIDSIGRFNLNWEGDWAQAKEEVCKTYRGYGSRHEKLEQNLRKAWESSVTTILKIAESAGRIRCREFSTKETCKLLRTGELSTLRSQMKASPDFSYNIFSLPQLI